MDGMRRQAVALGGFLIFGLVGIFFAIFASELNDRGIVVNEFINSSLTIGDVMGFTFLTFVLVGLLWYFMRGK